MSRKAPGVRCSGLAPASVWTKQLCWIMLAPVQRGAVISLLNQHRAVLITDHGLDTVLLGLHDGEMLWQ